MTGAVAEVKLKVTHTLTTRTPPTPGSRCVARKQLSEGALRKGRQYPSPNTRVLFGLLLSLPTLGDFSTFLTRIGLVGRVTCSPLYTDVFGLDSAYLSGNTVVTGKVDVAQESFWHCLALSTVDSSPVVVCRAGGARDNEACINAIGTEVRRAISLAYSPQGLYTRRLE